MYDVFKVLPAKKRLAVQRCGGRSIMESSLAQRHVQRIMCIVPLPLPRTDRSTACCCWRSPDALFHTAILLFHGANKAAALSPFPNGTVAHITLTDRPVDPLPARACMHSAQSWRAISCESVIYMLALLHTMLQLA